MIIEIDGYGVEIPACNEVTGSLTTRLRLRCCGTQMRPGIAKNYASEVHGWICPVCEFYANALMYKDAHSTASPGVREYIDIMVPSPKNEKEYTKRTALLLKVQKQKKYPLYV